MGIVVNRIDYSVACGNNICYTRAASSENAVREWLLEEYICGRLTSAGLPPCTVQVTNLRSNQRTQYHVQVTPTYNGMFKPEICLA